jgi:hypothetical protein
MKLWFLPHVREGLVPAAMAAGRPQVPVSLVLEAAGRTPRPISHMVPMLGPGDVLGIEVGQVLRVTPAAGTRDAEPDFFPAVEFDAPDLPWAYSPVSADSARVLPWIVLVVIEVTPDVVIAPGERGQSPWILRLNDATARRELPELIDTWGWAHAQVACETSSEIDGTLAQQPDRTLSRLLAPRRLLPFRPYLACVVPAFLSGLIAGLGEDPAADAAIVTGLEPAWTATRMPAALPVYYSWSFRTGEAGDFESLAQRLHAAPLDTSLPATPLYLSLPDGDGQTSVDWEPPLRVPGATQSRPPRPATAVSQITDALRPGTPGHPVLGPAYFGAPWIDSRQLDPATQWPAELNVTPMLRAAAGLGADAVRGDQEALVTAASQQLDQFRARQREGRRRQLAAAVVGRMTARLAAAPHTEAARVLAPLAARAQLNASNAGMYTAAGRRLTRKVSLSPFARPHITDTTSQPPLVIGTAAPGPVAIPAGDLPVLLPGVEYRPAVVRTPVVEPPPVAPVNPNAIDTGSFAPRFDRPLSETIAGSHPELMLPTTDTLETDGVLLVESHAAFVEAFLVGANQEFALELLWRGLPADRRATAFTRFWPHAGGAADIDDITTWDVNGHVGSHLLSQPAAILLIRSELVRRYPTVLIAAVPAVWKADGSRSPAGDPARLVLPGFRGRIGSDVLYAGFSQPSLADAIGGGKPDGPAGWFFLLSENPGDPRFGLDATAASTQPARATLAWTHLSLPTDARYATVAAFPPVPDANFSPQQATAASLASLTRQRPFRAFLHASLLVRLPAS